MHTVSYCFCCKEKYVALYEKMILREVEKAKNYEFATSAHQHKPKIDDPPTGK